MGNRDAPASLMLKTLAHEIGHFLNYFQGAGEGHDFFLKSGYVSDILNTMDGTQYQDFAPARSGLEPDLARFGGDLRAAAYAARRPSPQG